MIAVGSDDGVLAGHTSLHALSDGFLTVVEVAESSNFSLLVELVRHYLETAHISHIREHAYQLLLGDCGLLWQLVFVETMNAERTWLQTND